MKTVVLVLIVVLLGALGYYVIMKPSSVPSEIPGMEMEAEEIEEGADSGVSAEVSVDLTGELKEFVVEGGMFYFAPSQMQVNVGDTVRIVFKNKEGKHDFVIDEFNARTAVIDGGQEETIEFVATKAGSFEYYCSVGSHRANGMVGTLTVI